VTYGSLGERTAEERYGDVASSPSTSSAVWWDRPPEHLVRFTEDGLNRLLAGTGYRAAIRLPPPTGQGLVPPCTRILGPYRHVTSRSPADRLPGGTTDGTGHRLTEVRYQIGEVAEEVGLSLRTVRYYEEVGLVTPSDRTPGGFRLYTDEDIARLQLVKEMKPLGFTLEEMRDLLEVRERVRNGALEDEERERVLGRMAMYATTASVKIDELRASLEAAERSVEALRAETVAQAVGTRRRG
jgi:DNA-binding transcriptional MerR regulator